MHNRDKHPAIWAEKEAAEQQLATLMAKREVHTDTIAVVRLELQQVVAPYCEEINDLNELAMADYEQIKELNTAIARFAIAMGAVVASRAAPPVLNVVK